MERKLYLLSPLQAEFYENESDRMYPDDVMDGRALAVYGADILQKMQERADHVGEDPSTVLSMPYKDITVILAVGNNSQNA